MLVLVRFRGLPMTARVSHLAVFSREVGRVGDGWVASEGAVAAVMVVEVEPAVKGTGTGYV